MKTFKVKNYKGNLVESLKRFSSSHKGMKIVEAHEDGDDLKIKAEAEEAYDDFPYYLALGVSIGPRDIPIPLKTLPPKIFTSYEEAHKFIETENRKLLKKDPDLMDASYMLFVPEEDEYDL